MRWLRSLFSRTAAETPAPSAAAPSASVAAAPPSGWDSWRALLPEGPLAVALDLSLEPAVPDPARPRLLRVAYPLASPGPDGLPGAAEGEALARVEDALSAAFAAAGATYAGRLTLAGARQHLFYAPASLVADGPLAAAGGELAGYQVTVEAGEDPGWSGWRDELLPPPRTRRWLEDRREIEALARRGEPIALARPVDHQASFATAAAREAFTAEAVALGFAPAGRRDDAPPPSPFAVDLRRDDLVTLGHIHGVSWSLCGLAARHGGSYDGWEPAGG